MDERETIHQGWLELCTDSPNSKSFLKFSKKSWRRKYFVLYRLIEDSDKVYLVCFDKVENWHSVEPKKVLNLFPHYKIAKLPNYKGKENVLEVNNEQEQWHVTADKTKIIDLWATQIQMQTKLSRAISGRIFSVSGAVSKQMQKIGAAQQRCLLHFTKWGVTLALQDSRAILAMWPLKTIRNYESTSQCQFSVEAGRRSPMGEGLFVFHTNIGQDDEMFRVIDAFVSATLHEKAELNVIKKAPTTDEEILAIYDQLHQAATGRNIEAIQQHKPIDTPGYAPLGDRASIPHSSISIYKPPDYNRLFDDSGKRLFSGETNSPGDNLQGFETPRGLSFSDNANSYDQLDRKESWGSKSVNSEYDHIQQRREPKGATAACSYDQIDRRFSAGVSREPSKRNEAIVGYPLRDEPSVPYLDDNEKPFLGRSPLSKSSDSDRYEFRNSIYTPAKEDIYINEKDESIDESIVQLDISPSLQRTNKSSSSISQVEDLIGLNISRHSSTASEAEYIRIKQRTNSSFKDKPLQDIADHFLYQMPSPASLRSGVNETLHENINETVNNESTVAESLVTDEMYQNSDSVRDSVFSAKDP